MLCSRAMDNKQSRLPCYFMTMSQADCCFSLFFLFVLKEIFDFSRRNEQ
jgi:hypothetical protein